jgi:hypothetical protein
MQTCAVNAVDGYQYLRALPFALPKVQAADDYDALLPWVITPPTTPHQTVTSCKGAVK